MVLKEVGVRQGGKKPWWHGHTLWHDKRQDSIQDDMEGVVPKLKGYLEKRCLPKGLKLEKKPLPRLVLIRHVLLEALLNHLLKIIIGVP
jgi:hypothetical protein